MTDSQRDLFRREVSVAHRFHDAALELTQGYITFCVRDGRPVDQVEAFGAALVGLGPDQGAPLMAALAEAAARIVGEVAEGAGGQAGQT